MTTPTSLSLSPPHGGPVFIVGCPRSGTTLLRRLLTAHPRIAIPEESHFIPMMFEAYGDPKTEAEARRLTEVILSLRWIRDWKCPIDRESLHACRSFATLVAALFESHARHEGKPRWGDKTPQYVASIGLLAELFPDARFIHIHRDPRDAVPSWIAVPFGPKNAYVAAAEWRRFVTAGRRAGGNLPEGAYLEVGYEALVRDLESTMRTVCGFLGEDFHPDVLRPVPFTGRIQTPRFWKLAARPPNEGAANEPVEPSRAGRWSASLGARDRSIIESVAGEMMPAFGYDPEGPTRRISRVERVAWKLHGFAAESIAKINAYPAEDLVGMARELIVAGWRRRRRGRSRRETVPGEAAKS